MTTGHIRPIARAIKKSENMSIKVKDKTYTLSQYTDVTFLLLNRSIVSQEATNLLYVLHALAINQCREDSKTIQDKLQPLIHYTRATALCICLIRLRSLPYIKK